jgi:hypothetical protein
VVARTLNFAVKNTSSSNLLRAKRSNCGAAIQASAKKRSRHVCGQIYITMRLFNEDSIFGNGDINRDVGRTIIYLFCTAPTISPMIFREEKSGNWL